MKLHFFLLFLLSLISACTAVEQGYVKPPLVHRIDIQQGNEISQSQLNKLRVGMDERQVKFIMGTPLLIDPFHPERWEYVYFKQVTSRKSESRKISLFFKDKRLSHLQGNVKVSFLPIKNVDTNTERSVNVPESYRYRGLFARWFDNKPDLNKKTKEKFKAIVNENIESEKIDDDIVEEETEAADTDAKITEADIINDVDTNLDIEETKTDEIISSEEPVDSKFSLKPADDGGFFSRMWNKVLRDSDEDKEETYQFSDDEAKQ